MGCVATVPSQLRTCLLNSLLTFIDQLSSEQELEPQELDF